MAVFDYGYRLSHVSVSGRLKVAESRHRLLIRWEHQLKKVDVSSFRYCFVQTQREGWRVRRLVILAVSCAVVFTVTTVQSQSPRIQRAPVDGGEIEYQIWGNGDPILLIHGGAIAGMPESFLTAAALAEYQLIAYNRRGYAGSAPERGPFESYAERQASDAVALLHHLDIDSAHILGHSSGGAIALQFALDYPANVRSLILLEPALPAEVGTAPVNAIRPQLFERIESGDFAEALNLFMRAVTGQPEWRSSIARDYPGGVQQAEQDAETFFSFESPAIRSWHPQEAKIQLIDQPVLYVYGSESTVPLAVRDLVRMWFPQTDTFVVDGASHFFHAEEPRTTAEGIADFLP